MIQRALAFLLMMVVVIPFFVLGIVATTASLLWLLGIGPGEKSLTFLALFVLVVPFGVGGFGLIGYGLLVALLRLAGIERWFDTHNPPGGSGKLAGNAAWVRSLVHRLLPRTPAGA